MEERDKYETVSDNLDELDPRNGREEDEFAADIFLLFDEYGLLDTYKWRGHCGFVGSGD